MIEALRLYAEFLKEFSSRAEVGLDQNTLFMVCIIPHSTRDSLRMRIISRDIQHWFQRHGLILDNLDTLNKTTLKEVSYYYWPWLHELKDVTND